MKYMTLFFVVLFTFGCSKNFPRVEIIKMPATMYSTRSYVLEFKLHKNGIETKSDDIGILDITFSGNPVVAINAASDVWSKPHVYPPGSEIWHKRDETHNDSYPMKARNLLVSVESIGWDKISEKTLKLNVTPSKQEVLSIYVSGAFVDSNHSQDSLIRFPETSDNINQQGYPCILYEIQVK